MATKISPTVGRVVWVRNRPGAISSLQPEVGFITYVHSDSCINVGGFDANGEPFRQTSLFLVQDGSGSQGGPYAEWMPYQKGHAAKTEALEQQLASPEQPQAAE
jgi:hypothetical protein